MLEQMISGMGDGDWSMAASLLLIQCTRHYTGPTKSSDGLRHGGGCQLLGLPMWETRNLWLVSQQCTEDAGRSRAVAFRKKPTPTPHPCLQQTAAQTALCSYPPQWCLWACRPGLAGGAGI